MGKPPSSAEYNLFAPYMRQFGDNNHLVVLTMYLIHMCLRDVSSTELEILDKGPSVLKHIRDLTGEFDKTLHLVEKIARLTINLSVSYSSLEHSLKEREKRDRTKWERIYNLVVRHHHPVKLLATLWAGMLFVNFAGLILIAYVLGLTPPLLATSTPPSEQAEISGRPMQSWKQPNRGLTPGEMAAEDREWETE